MSDVWTSRCLLALALIFTAYGCRTMGESRDATPRSATSTSPSAIAAVRASTVASADAGIAATPMPPAPVREDRGWNTFPATGSTLSYVADGYCTLMDVSFLGETTLLKYGEHTEATVARVTKEGALVDADRLSRSDPGAFKYGRPVGSFPDALYWPVDMGGRAFYLPTISHYTEERGWVTPPAEGAPLDFVGPYGRGFLAVRLTCSNAAEQCRGAGIVAVGETTPTLASDSFLPTAMRAWPDKSVIVVGQVCSGGVSGCATEARHFAPEKGRKVFRLGTDLGNATIAARSADDVLAAFGEGTVMHFDGAKWTRVTAPTKKAEGVELLGVAPDGAIWAASLERIFRQKSDGAPWEEVSPPVVGGGSSRYRDYTPRVDGIALGHAWAIRGSALYRASATGDVHWEQVPIPPSPFAAKKSPPAATGVRVKSADEVWVNVTYTESYGDSSRFEARRALLRTGTVVETVRCRARDNVQTDSRRGFESWPPRAEHTCATPAVVIGRGKLDQDGFPRTRALLKGRKELGMVELVEVPNEVGAPYVVARLSSFEVAKKLSLSLLSKIYAVVPEVVCAEPKGKRIRVDASTGEIAAAPQ